MSNIAQPAGIWSRGHRAGRRAGLELLRDDRAAGAAPAWPRPWPSAPWPAPPGRPRPATFPVSSPIARKKVQAMAPPTRIASTLRQQGLDQVDLAGDLGAAQHRDERPLRMIERLAEVLELLFHQEAGDRRLEQVRHRLGAGVGPVGRAEGVVDVEIAERGEDARPARGRSSPRPAWNRVFSTTAMPPRGSRLVTGDGVGRRGSAMKVTGAPSSFSSSRTQGWRLYFGSGPPLGRPRWDSSTTRAPFSRRYRMVGSEARIRVLSADRAVLDRTVEVDPDQRPPPVERGGVE